MRKTKLRRSQHDYRLSILRAAYAEVEPERNLPLAPRDFIRVMGESDLNVFDLWLISYVIRGVLPTTSELSEYEFEVLHEGGVVWLTRLLRQAPLNPNLRFEVVPDAILVDVYHTAQANLLTGIQRVTFETVSRWCEAHDPLLIAWDDNWRYLRKLRLDEAVKFGVSRSPGDETTDRTALIPLGGQYTLVELNADPERVSRLSALIDATQVKLNAVAYDCVPITSSETTASGMPYFFATYLDFLSRADRIAPISRSARGDFEGWKTALSVTGLQGPEIKEVTLGAAVSKPNPGDYARLTDLGIRSDIPVVTCVGSHEPRKNHLAVLRAAERLWESGSEFQLVFIGGNSWNSEFFFTKLNELHRRGHHVISLSKISDELMHAAVESSLFSVFPSLNEGFGLPVAESLLLGTPVITSNYGSMSEIGGGYGSILVDPRDDNDIVSAMARLLTEPELVRQLQQQTQSFPEKDWNMYSAELWDYLVTANPPNH